MGIDPGFSGGIAIIDCDTKESFAWKMPQTEVDLAEALTKISRQYNNNDEFIQAYWPSDFICYLEKVGGMKTDGGSRAFKFGMQFGAIVGILAILKVKTVLVPPAKWMRHLNCLTGGNKNVTKRKAQQLFPHVKITHAKADALLIAEYGRQRETGMLNERRKSKNTSSYNNNKRIR